MALIATEELEIMPFIEVKPFEEELTKRRYELGWQPVYSSWRRGFLEGLG